MTRRVSRAAPAKQSLLRAARSAGRDVVSQVDSYWIGNHTHESRYCLQTQLRFALANSNLEALKLLREAGFSADTLFLDLDKFDPGYLWEQRYISQFGNTAVIEKVLDQAGAGPELLLSEATSDLYVEASRE
eukprot:gene7912-9398_t